MPIPIVFYNMRRPVIDWSFLGAMPSSLTFTRASSGTRFNSSGVLESVGDNLPRFDYDPLTLAPRGLLMEEQRTNLLTSSNLSSALYNALKIGSTFSANAALAPDGTVSATKLIETTATSSHIRGTTTAISLASDAARTYSFFAKAGERTRIRGEFLTNTSGGLRTIFDLTGNGAVVENPYIGGSGTQISASIKNVGGGWYRCSSTFKPSTAGTALTSFNLQLVQSGTTTSYTGDGISGAYIWGCHLEVGDMATTYVPTTSAAVTRAADDLRASSLPWFSPIQGTILVEFIPSNVVYPVVTAGIASFNDNTGNNRLTIRHAGNSSACNFRAVSGGTTYFDQGVGTLVAGAVNKVAMAFGSGYIAGCANGSTPVTGSSLVMPAIFQLQLMNELGNRGNGNLRIAKYWNRALSASELQRITS